MRSPIVLAHLYALLFLDLVHVSQDVEAMAERCHAEVDERFIIERTQHVAGDAVFYVASARVS